MEKFFLSKDPGMVHNRKKNMLRNEYVVLNVLGDENRRCTQPTRNVIVIAEGFFKTRVCVTQKWLQEAQLCAH